LNLSSLMRPLHFCHLALRPPRTSDGVGRARWGSLLRGLTKPVGGGLGSMAMMPVPIAPAIPAPC